MSYEDIVKELKKLFEGVEVKNVKEHFAIQFNIVGEGEGALYCELKDCKVDVQPYEYYDRDAIVNVSYPVLFELVKGNICLVDAYKEDKLSVWGDLDRADYIIEASSKFIKK